MQEFLRFLLDNFRVAVWTSNIRENADELVRLAFGERAKELLFVWSREQCDLEPPPGYGSTKSMDKIWKAFPQFHPLNTYMLDDSPEKITGTGARDVHIQLETFEASPDSVMTDNELMHWKSEIEKRYLMGTIPNQETIARPQEEYYAVA
jgi:hypothetical protein